MVTITFDLDDAAPWGNLSSGTRSALTEAAAVMLTMHCATGTCSGTWAHGGIPKPLCVTWPIPDQIAQASHGNTKDATEDGAYAIAIHAVTHLGWSVLGRLQQGSGADWHVLDPNQGKNMKLEVSGISKGGVLESRLKQKVLQVKGGPALPGWSGMAVAFRFSDARLLSEVL